MLKAIVDVLRLHTESTISKDVLEQRVKERIPFTSDQPICFTYAVALFWSEPSSVLDGQTQNPKYAINASIVSLGFTPKYLASIMYRSTNRLFLPPWLYSSQNELTQLVSMLPSLFLNTSSSYKSIHGVTDLLQRCTMSFSQIALIASILLYLSHIPLDQDRVPCVEMICQENQVIHDERQFSYIMEWRMQHTVMERFLQQPELIVQVGMKMRQLISEACIALCSMIVAPIQTSFLQYASQRLFFSTNASQQTTTIPPKKNDDLLRGVLTNPGRPLCVPYAELGTCHHSTFAQRFIDQHGQVITNEALSVIQKEVQEKSNIYLMDHVHVKQVSDAISRHIVHNTCMYIFTDGRRTCIERNRGCRRSHVLLFFHRLKNIIVEESYSENTLEQWKTDRTKQQLEYIAMPSPENHGMNMEGVSSSSTSSSSSSSSSSTVFNSNVSFSQQFPTMDLLVEPGRPLCIEWIQGEGKCRHSAFFFRFKDKLRDERVEFRNSINPDKKWKEGDYINAYRLDHPQLKDLRTILMKDSSEKHRVNHFCRFVVDSSDSICGQKGASNCVFRHGLLFYDRIKDRFVHDDSKSVTEWKTQIHEREDKYYSKKIFHQIQQRDQQWDSSFFPTKQPLLKYQPKRSRSRSRSCSRSRSRSPIHLPNLKILNEPGRPICTEWMNRKGKCKHLVYFFRFSNKIRKDHGQKINSTEANRCWRKGDYINFYRLDHPHPEKLRSVMNNPSQLMIASKQCWNIFANEYQYPDYDRYHSEKTCQQDHSIVFFDYNRNQLVVDSSVPAEEWKMILFQRETKYISDPIFDCGEWKPYVYPTRSRSRSRSTERGRRSPSRIRNRSRSPNEWNIRSP